MWPFSRKKPKEAWAKPYKAAFSLQIKEDGKLYVYADWNESRDKSKDAELANDLAVVMDKTNHGDFIEGFLNAVLLVGEARNERELASAAIERLKQLLEAREKQEESEPLVRPINVFNNG